MRKTLSVKHHRNPAERAEILSAYERGGLTQKALAAQYHIAVSTLHRWRGCRQADQERGTKRLIEVPNLLATQGAGGPYRLRFPSGLVLEVAAGFEPKQVRALAQVIQSL